MKPVSDNVVFLDTEFSSLDPYKGELLSVAVIKLSGEELYLEFEYDGPVDNWPKAHILPLLTGPKVSRTEGVKRLRTFVDPDKPYAVAFIDSFDMIYLYKLFGNKPSPFRWVPIDFASMLFARGLDPEDYLHNQAAFFGKLGIDYRQYNQHDARLLRETYLKLIA